MKSIGILLNKGEEKEMKLLILESWFDYISENIKIFLGMFSFFMILSFSTYMYFLYGISYNINIFTLIWVIATTGAISLYFTLIFSFYLNCVNMLKDINEDVNSIGLWTFLPALLAVLIGNNDISDFNRYWWYLSVISIMLTIIPVILIMDDKNKLIDKINSFNSKFIAVYDTGERLSNKLIKTIDSITGVHYKASLYTNIPLYCATNNIIKIFHTDFSKIMYDENIQEILKESYRIVKYYRNKSRQHLLGDIVRSKIYINNNKNITIYTEDTEVFNIKHIEYIDSFNEIKCNVLYDTSTGKFVNESSTKYYSFNNEVV
jgi:hypothetical protein